MLGQVARSLYHKSGPIKDRVEVWRNARKAHAWDAEDQKRADFYGPFMGPGDLVFDVGANRGNRTKVFLKLGCKVVSVEPQPRLCRILKASFGDDITIEQCAVVAQPGPVQLHTARDDIIATTNPDWIRESDESGRFGKDSWGGTIEVPGVTLDHLVALHGLPRFIKIDIEGAEEAALKGLSQPVQGLSLEFTPQGMHRARGCVDRLASLGRYEFSYADGEIMKLATGWQDAAGIKAYLGAIPKEAFGDIYAQLRG